MSIEEKLSKEFDKQLEENINVNIMVVGGTGVGKSSLINSVFGEAIAPVGSGEPVTKGINKYKNSNIPVIIYDTEGYEIIDNKINNDNFETVVIREIKERQKLSLNDQIHIFWYCISAINHRITSYDLENIKSLSSLGIKLAIVITKCDEEEIDENGQGKTSQIFKNELINAGIKNNAYETMTVGDDTLELNQLLDWSSQSLSNDDLKRAFIGAQIKNIPLKDQEANTIIYSCSASAAAAAGLNPLPLSDALIITPIQIGMAVKLAKIYSIDSLGRNAMALLKTQLLSLLGKQLAASLTKFIPVVGQLINAGIAGGLTVALGFALQKIYSSAYLEYLETGKEPNWVHLFESIDLMQIVKDAKTK